MHAAAFIVELMRFRNVRHAMRCQQPTHMLQRLSCGRRQHGEEDLARAASAAATRAMRCDHQAFISGGPRRLVPITVDASLLGRRRPVTAGLVSMAAVWPCVKSLRGGLCHLAREVRFV